MLSTYWLEIKPKASGSVQSGGSNTEVEHLTEWTKTLKDADQKDRLVDWMTDLFIKYISSIIARQDKSKSGKAPAKDLVYHRPEGKTSLDEVAEVIQLPKFDSKAASRAASCGEATVPTNTRDQLREVVSRVANLYLDNPFHNFDHACHVTMAVGKSFLFLI